MTRVILPDLRSSGGGQETFWNAFLLKKILDSYVGLHNKIWNDIICFVSKSSCTKEIVPIFYLP